MLSQHFRLAYNAVYSIEIFFAEYREKLIITIGQNVRFHRGMFPQKFQLD